MHDLAQIIQKQQLSTDWAGILVLLDSTPHFCVFSFWVVSILVAESEAESPSREDIIVSRMASGVGVLGGLGVGGF